MIGFLHPELLLCAVPLALLLWRARGEHPVTMTLRAVGALALVAALAGPYLKTGAAGRDVVLVVDRSRSMPSGSDTAALELISLAEESAGPLDRVHVVAFGARAHIERAGGSNARFDSFQREIDADGSDLAGALDTALQLVSGGRGSVLVISDGEAHGRDPLDVARRAASLGVRIDARSLGRPNVSDVSVERIALPGEVAAGEPFQFDVWVRSDRRVERELVLSRDGQPLTRVLRTIEPGLQRFTFRDIVGEGGVAQYELALRSPTASPGAAQDDDRVPENDRARAALLVSGPRAILLLNENGVDDTLSATLRAAGLDVRVAAPEEARLDVVALTRFRAVVLENVAASRLGRQGMIALASFVEDHGGGLLMTGGQAAFGAGGYYKSPLDEVLPVSTELRQEHRKLSLAMAITMDRSGSMAAPVSGGGTKMDLANAGAAAAIELLTPNDSVAVIAVDSAAHVIQALTPVTDVEGLKRTVRSIRSMGGGIFTYTALVEAARQIKDAPQLNRHVVLFADAADAEEHEGCFELIATLRKLNTTLSVIALGTEHDSDAEFLKECALRGGGGAYFSTDPVDLPRLFAMDTLTMSRSTFVDERTETQSLAGLLGMGAFDGGAFPAIDGYNLSYLRPGATAGAITKDEYAAPVVAFWQRGLGRSAALTTQVGGQFGGALLAWPRFPEFGVTLARWLAGNEPPGDFFASTRREGREAVISVEVDASVTLAPDTSRLVAHFGSGDGDTRALPLTRVDQNLFEARLPLDREGVLVGTVDLGDGRSLALAPQTLAYSPEFERGPDPESGARTLRRIVAATGGAVDPSTQDLFRGTRGARLWRIVTRELALFGLVVLLLEIAGRRLSLWGSVRLGGAWSRRVAALRARRAQRPAVVDRDLSGVSGPPGPGRTAASPSAEPAAPTRTPTPTPTSTPTPTPTPTPGAASGPADARPPRTDDAAPNLGSALERARRASQRKLDR